MSPTAPTSGSAAPIAIVGMACTFPQAPDLKAFWNNILDGVDAVGEPLPSWDAARYLATGRIKTQFGGYLRELYRFDPREFGIMPNSLDGGEPDQLLALRVARDALADAGYLGRDADHTDTGVILGHSTYLHRGQVTVIQHNVVLDQTIELVRAALPELDDASLFELRERLRQKLPPHNADTAPGLVPNVMTGRIANRLNLRGPNYLVDGACSSSLLAVAAAVDELRAGRSRMMLAGGVNASLPADVCAIFTQLGALSARGRVRPFEKGSDGTLLGEGLGIVVLKRLDDALADGDRIYAVIRGVGQASDGRVTGLLAPSQEGETLAILRAYRECGVDPDTVSLVEAHGTGIPLGDKTEIAALKAVFGERDTPVGVKAIGSVKSMISHCIPAAGVAGLIKAALALHHKVLPPTLCEEVNPELGIDATPFYVNTCTAPWIASLRAPRRAAVNAFGFGGVNTHAVLEQSPAAANRPPRLGSWPAELCVVSADTAEALAARLARLRAALGRNPGWRLADVAATLAREDRGAQHRVAMVARDLSGLAKCVGQALQRLRDGDAAARSGRGTVAYASQRIEGKLAFLFPGEGSQYPAMFADLALCFDDMQRWLDFWHGLYDLPRGRTRTDVVFPSCEVDPERRRKLEQRLYDMDVGSEAVFIGGMAMHELLVALGVTPDAMLGHSTGESVALGASGANPALTPQEREDCIRQHYKVYEELLRSGKIPKGALLAVGALPPATVEAQVAAAHGVVIAMDNCSNQMVLYGDPAGIAAVQKSLSELGGICLPLPFDRGYHTPAFADASEAFLGYYKDVRLGVPKVPVYSCAIAGLFPHTPGAVRRLAAAQWSHKVRFRETVLQMHDDGVRLFVEVGPSSSLTSFVNDILIDRDYLALATNARRRNGVEQLLSTLGQLYVAGRGPVLERLFAGRALDEVDLDAMPPAPRGVLLDNTLPVLRLDDADREALRRLGSAGRAHALPTSVAPTTEPLASATVIADEAVPVIAADDGRCAVMNEYFALMRGFLDQQRALVESVAVATPDVTMRPAWPSTHAKDSCTPLLDEIIEHDAERLVARCRVGLLNDAFIRDHVMSGPVSDTDERLFGLSCVPFAASLEAMAEACCVLAGHTGVRVIENVKAFDWLALDHGELEFEVQAQQVDRRLGRYAARVRGPRGIALAAEFGFVGDRQIDAVPPLAERRVSCLNRPHLYDTGMFHGPVFQSMHEVQDWDDSGIDVALSDASLAGFFTEAHVPRLVLNPVLLDAMGQVVACWLAQYVGFEFHAFPSTIERLELYEDCPCDRAGMVLRMRQRVLDGNSSDISAPRAWQFECVDAEGRVLMRGRDLVNLFFLVPPQYHRVRIDPLNQWLGSPVPVPVHADVALWEVPLMAEDVCSQSGSICLRILAHALLAPCERDEWHALQGQLRRRREWLFGRAALKEAVRLWVHERTGTLLYPSDVVVRYDERGAPVVGGWWCDSLSPPPRVSLSHNADACLAAVAPPDLAVGVDFERLGRIQQPSLMVESLAAQELPWVQGLQGGALDERLLRLWCGKEAAAKCLGIGLRGQPSAFVVAAADPGFESLTVSYESDVVHTRVVRREDIVIAVANAQVAEGWTR